MSPKPRRTPRQRDLLALKIGCGVLAFFLVLVIGLVLSSNHAPATDATPVSTPTVASDQPTAVPTWSDGAIAIFHSTHFQTVGGYTDAFSVPDLWRIKWFCVPGTDVSQNFFSISVQHAGDLTPADGATPLEVDCGSQHYGTLDEHVGGSVTLQILAGTSVSSWDVYVQTPM